MDWFLYDIGLRHERVVKHTISFQIFWGLSPTNFTWSILEYFVSCRSATNQLNALIRLKNLLGFAEKKVHINSFFYSKLNYCLLLWMFRLKNRFKSFDPKRLKSLPYHLRSLLGLRKLRSSKKVEILQVLLVLRDASWKNIFYHGANKRRFFPHFHYEIIFCCAELFEYTFNVKDTLIQIWKSVNAFVYT